MTFRFRLLERAAYDALLVRLDRARTDRDMWARVLAECAVSADAPELLLFNSDDDVADIRRRVHRLRGGRSSPKRLAECAIPLLCAPDFQIRPTFSPTADALLNGTSPTLVDLGGGGDGGLFGQLTEAWFVLLFVTAFHERVERYPSLEGPFFCLSTDEVRQLAHDLNGLPPEGADAWERIAVKRLRRLCERAIAIDGIVSVTEVY